MFFSHTEIFKLQLYEFFSLKNKGFLNFFEDEFYNNIIYYPLCQKICVSLPNVQKDPYMSTVGRDG